jgi:hypothetical protein
MENLPDAVESQLLQTARRCKELEDDYRLKRQRVGLETLERIHVSMADKALQSKLKQIRDACQNVGGVFATRVLTKIDGFLETFSE